MKNMKFIIGGAILLLPVVYIFSFDVYKNNQNKFLLQQQEKCRQAGDIAYKADLKQYTGYEVYEPEYAYNKKLNTCIYSSGYRDIGDNSEGVSNGMFGNENCNSSWTKWIKDSFTNRKIIEISNFHYKCEWTTKTEEIETYNDKAEAFLNNKN